MTGGTGRLRRWGLAAAAAGPGGRRRPGRLLVGASVVLAFGGGTLLGTSLGGGQGTVRPAFSSSSGVDAGSAGPSGSTGAGAATAGGAPSGSAAALPGETEVYCTVVSGDMARSATVSGCDKPGVTGGAGTVTSGSLATPGSLTVTWNGTGTTTFVYWYQRVGAVRDKCPAGQTEFVVHGTVTANSPSGSATHGVKGAVRGRLCVDAALGVSLLPGQVFRL